MISTKAASQTFQANTTFQGFYLRNKITGTNTLPATAPYDLCPDIIQSAAPLNNPSGTLGSASSWASTYNVAPLIGQDNYYYVRGTNGTQIPKNSLISLYYAPAQLILLPETWQNNILSSTAGNTTIALKAGAGSNAVTNDAFVWPATPMPAAGSDFYSFVGQVNNLADDNPVPSITSWLDMADLLSQNLGFGFRNTCQVEANSTTWAHQFMMNIPSTITDPSTLQISIGTAGMVGNTISLQSSDPGKLIDIKPYTVVSDGSLTYMNFNAPAGGYSGSLKLGFANNSGSFPVQGAAITVCISYAVPANEVHGAGKRGLLQPAYSKHISKTANTDPGMPVQQYAMIGSVTFVVS